MKQWSSEGVCAVLVAIVAGAMVWACLDPRAHVLSSDSFAEAPSVPPDPAVCEFLAATSNLYVVSRNLGNPERSIVDELRSENYQGTPKMAMMLEKVVDHVYDSPNETDDQAHAWTLANCGDIVRTSAD